MSRYARCPSCGGLAEVSAGATACPECGAEVAPPADARRATVRNVEVAIPTLVPTRRPTAEAVPAGGLRWRVGGPLAAAVLAALALAAHVAWRVTAPEAVAELPAPVPNVVAPVVSLPPTNTARPTPKPAPRVAAPIALDSPPPPAAETPAEWVPFAPAGLRLRVSLPGERRHRVLRLAGKGGATVEATEDAGAECGVRYIVLTLPSSDGPLTPATLPKLLASLRPDSLVAPRWLVAGPQEYVAWEFAAHDGTDWGVFAFARAGKLVLLVRSRDRASPPDEAGLTRFLDSVELVRED